MANNPPPEPTIGVGRVHLPASMCPAGVGGPTPVAIRDGDVFDASALGSTVADLMDVPDLAVRLRDATLPRLGAVSDAIEEAEHGRRRPDRLHFLSPCDLQVIKAAGVTFAQSLLERVVEEHSAGSPDDADAIRERLMRQLGDLASIKPGSDEASAAKDTLTEAGLWSGYLEVGLGKDAELFTKAPVLASVGTGEQIGVRRDSAWSNPEPEIVLVVDSRAQIIGASVGNDVNLRDFEGRSPLLLGEAKDNTASCAIGPWFTLFEPEAFTLEALALTNVVCEVEGLDGFRATGSNRLAAMSRDPRDLVAQATGHRHQYPDGFVLFLGTMYVPTTDRDAPGRGFTHHEGDLVRISNPYLGTLENRVAFCDDVPSWRLGIRELFKNLTKRGLA